MKIGLIPVNMGVESAEQMIEVARAAESAGIESVWTFEHVIIPVDYESKYPYNPTGKMGVPPEINLADPLIALTAIAANTTTLRLATGVNILTQASPLYVAKQAASLDWASNGRFMLGIGIGWLREEFAALGVPFERRGARFDDYIQALRKVWAGDVVEHHGEFVDWSGFKSYPVPVQQRDGVPAVPCIIGGSKGKVFERIAKYGDGWYAPTNTAEQLEAMLPALDAACAAEGRDRSTVEITAMWVPAAEAVDQVKRYEDLGVSRLVVPIFALGGPPLEAIDKFGTEVLPQIS